MAATNAVTTTGQTPVFTDVQKENSPHCDITGSTKTGAKNPVVDEAQKAQETVARVALPELGTHAADPLTAEFKDKCSLKGKEKEGHVDTGDPEFDELWNHPGPRPDVPKNAAFEPSRSNQTSDVQNNNPFQGKTSKSLVGLLNSAGYKNGRHLGHGTYGSVNLFTNEKGEGFAVKTLKASKVLDPNPHVTRWFEANVGQSGKVSRGEAVAIELTGHPNVLRTDGLILYNENTGLYRIVTNASELKPINEEREVVMGTLTQAISDSAELSYAIPKGGLSIKETKNIALQIASALAYLHEKGMIHRDVKPENILYDPKTGKAYLIDFGFLRNLQEAEQGRTKTYCGTRYYMAPEVFERQKYGTEVDAWSIGVTLFIVKFGYFPFYGETAEDTYDEVRGFINSRQYFSEYLNLHEHKINPEEENFLELIDDLITHKNNRLTMEQVLQHSFFS